MPTTSSVLGGGITINEIHTFTGGGTLDFNGDSVVNNNDMFIEIVNTSGSPIDISGYELWGFNGTIIHTFDPGTTLAAGDHITVVASNGGTVNPISNVSGTAVYSDNNMSFGDASNLTLYDPNANTYIVVQGSSGAPWVSFDVGPVITAHPGATQTGATEVLASGSGGQSWLRSPDGDSSWVLGGQSAGDVNCFAADTEIHTPEGIAQVTALEIGDVILTACGGTASIKWIGRQTVSTRFGPAERLMPVRFAAGSLGDGLPHADLTVTADHGMLVDGVICHAGALVNGTTITRVPMSEMGQTYTVYHIETDEHEIILANGAPAETFIDNVSRRSFDNFAEFETLYGDVPEMEELPFPRAMSARQVPGHIQARLAAPKVA
ncbi:Hint domain-containing protein [Nioella sp.]|uniref:Hint domain-containing protein n=1 Tax=Nioella sp. TaxID=1912091 RepID=UPI003B517DEF